MSLELARRLAECGHTAPSADNSQPWHFYWDGEQLSVCYDRERLDSRSFGPLDPATLMAIGSVLENIRQYADSQNIEFKMEVQPASTENRWCYARIALPRSRPSVPKPKPDARFQPTRHTNRFGYQAKSIAADKLTLLLSYSEGTTNLKVVQDRQQIMKVASLVKHASQLRFQIRAAHEMLGTCLRFTPQSAEGTGDGLDVRTLGLPPGGSLLLRLIRKWGVMRILNTFGFHRLMAAVDSIPLQQAPALVALIGEDSYRGALDAGRLLTRCWEQLNLRGIAVHPYYAITDQLNRLASGTMPEKLVKQAVHLHQDTRNTFGLSDNQMLFMVLRTGYPTRNPQPSTRLPFVQVFTDLGNSPIY